MELSLYLSESKISQYDSTDKNSFVHSLIQFIKTQSHY